MNINNTNNINYILNNTNSTLLREFILLNLETLNLKTKYENGNTVLHTVCIRGFDELLLLILKNKYKTNSKELKVILSIVNDDNFSPLHEAASYGYTQICEHLINFGANMDLKNNLDNTPIHYAIINGHQDTVELLIEKNSNLQIVNKDKQTPYKLMFKYMKNCIDKLLDKKRIVVARVSSIYKKNLKIIEEQNVTIDRDLQTVFCKNSKIIKTNKQFLNKQSKKHKNISNNKVTPFKNILVDKLNKLKKISKKECNIKNLSTLNIKDKKLLVEYDYTEINDKDIMKFINSGNLEIIKHKWFDNLMNYYWISFAKKFFIQQFTISLIYMILFFLSSTLYTYNSIYFKDFNNYTTHNNKSFITTDIDKHNNYIIFKSVYSVLDGFIFIFNTLYFINEICEIKKLTKKKNLISYIFDKWNLFDNTQIFLVYATIILKFFHNNNEKIIISFLYPIFFIKFLKLLRGFRRIGPYIRVIFRMMKDIFQFMSILSIFIVGFGQSFFTLLYNTPSFINPFTSIITTFDMIIRDYDFDSSVENSIYKNEAMIIYRIYLVVAVIILLNMLIAILETSYNKIIESANNEWKLERSRLILSLMNSLITKKNFKTVEDINKLYSLEIDKPVKGIENFKLEYIQ